MRTPAAQAVAEPNAPRVDRMLDLQGVPPSERWVRISDTIRQLDLERGRDWRIKVLLRDSPEAASEFPGLVRQINRAGLRFDTTREPGGVQGTVLSPGAGCPEAPPAAASGT